MIKIPPWSKALSAEHRLKFAALSSVMVTAARDLKNCSYGYKQTQNISEIEFTTQEHDNVFNYF
jgi:hypothetical protein